MGCPTDMYLGPGCQEQAHILGSLGLLDLPPPYLGLSPKLVLNFTNFFYSFPIAELIIIIYIMIISPDKDQYFFPWL